MLTKVSLPLFYLSKSIKNNNKPNLLFHSNVNYLFFNLNKQNNQSDQLKGQGRKKSQSQLSPLDSITFPFPFQWTLQSNNYKYYDPRFTEQPIKKSLQISQQQHILYVLQNLEGFLNSNNQSTNSVNKGFNKNYSQQALKQYIHKSLSGKLNQFIQSLKNSQISIKLHIPKESITKTQGYMEIQAKNIDQSSSINFLSPKYIHEYEFQRQKQLLLIQQKKQKTKKSQQQLLQQDVKDMMDQKSNKKQIKQFFEQVQKGKVSDSQRAANFLMSKLKGLANKKAPKKREQQRYATSQMIKGKVHFQVIYKNNVICDQETDLHTKWLYVVEKNEPQSIKKSRKRILYDFQFWNRGCVFEVKDWVKQITV